MPDFTPNNVWATSTPSRSEEELTTPLGQTVRARKMSMDGMIAAGILADSDALTSMVSKHTRKIKGAKGKPDRVEIDEKSVLRDSSAIVSLIGLMDKALPHIVVSPPVALHYEELTVGKTKVTKTIPEDRRIEMRENTPGIVFTDQVAFEDKVFLFDWAAGGLSNLIAFRNGS